MGTRSLIHFEEDKQTLVTVYRQMDGYPSYRGNELAEFLAARRITNGISGDATGTANGMGCLAAQWIAHEKNEVGSVYIHPPNSSDCWEEYVYTVKSDGDDGTVLTAQQPNKPPFFDGNPADFDGEALEKKLYE